jgi:hypothetical protein
MTVLNWEIKLIFFSFGPLEFNSSVRAVTVTKVDNLTLGLHKKTQKLRAEKNQKILSSR